MSPTVHSSTGLLALVSILLTVGPPLGLWPLVYWLPGFNFIRVPSRFWILATLALAVLSAIGCERLRDRLGPRWRPLLLPVLATLLLLEFSTVPLAVTPFRVRASAADRWLADQAAPFVVAEVPLSGSLRDQSAYMLHSMAHWQPTVHGYSGLEPAGHTALYEAMRRFPEPGALEALRGFNVTYVAVHIDRFAPGRWAAVERELAVIPSLELLFRDETSRAYRLHR
ncbi:MAG TPA: hypothetical protein VNJ03_01575 [Vicinamibacterales bacterium]|nr:hypothetical protein [Vicinamibacterales bacterium]